MAKPTRWKLIWNKGSIDFARIVEGEIDFMTPEEAERRINAFDGLVEALRTVVTWFDRMEQDHDEKLGHGLQQAIEEWPNILQEPLDMKPIKEALAAAEGK